ncbi:hypothetical protein ITQ90_06675 [Pediococcus pentosaceus]|uniref:Uncharacterized protein n=1 Tax=Pediococcus pentosaceus TaxID=1255 RepID=A0AB73HI29_PEDPE|nr:hypothetical protein [Pediococcus pentosaceus]MBF7115167.1 hypothetical protein [Pediococcus pentosaceus]MDN3207347.1 hypothetical protein [Pediococcus pentosaceus]
MSIKLKTDNLSPELGNNFRNDLVDNFSEIEKEINGLDSANSGDQITKEDLDKKLDKLKNDFMEDNEALKKRINRILLGTDIESIEIVVNRILKEKGVSN